MNDVSKVSSELLRTLLEQTKSQENVQSTTVPAPYGLAPRISKAAMWSASLTVLLVLGAVLIGTHDVLALCSVEGLLIVGGGVIAVAFMSFQSIDVITALKAVGEMFMESPPTLDNLQHNIIDIMNWARIVKTKGMRGLEEKMSGIEDPFIRYGLNMVVSNYTPEDVRAMMETAAEAYYERNTLPAHILAAMGGHAPAFGMIGTLIGMIIMLYNFNEDITGVGPGLAIAFLSTLYGVVLARLIYIPAAAKLMQRQDNLRFRNQLIIEGLMMLVGNKSPHYIQDRLNSFLKLEEIHGRVGANTHEIPVPKLKVI